MSLPSVAVFGCGYWGQNLVRNFYQIGALRLVCDPAEKGRTRAAEIAPGVEICGTFDEVFKRKDIQSIVLAGGGAMQIAEAAKRAGVRDLRQSALLKVKNGITSLAEINRVTKD